MLDNNDNIEDTVVTMYQMSDEEKIKEQRLARDLYYFDRASAYRYGYTLGLQEATDQKEKTIILNMHNKNMSPEKISELTDIPLEKIMSLIQDNN